MTVSRDLVNYKKWSIGTKHMPKMERTLKPLRLEYVILERYETLKIVKELSTGGKVCHATAVFHINLS